MAETLAAAAPLEEVMLAMDVVDTLRHRQLIVDRELDAEGRRERLIERLREIYAAQGMDVPDAVLAEGVRALEEDRFRYDPPEPSLSRSLARAYVRRDKWGKPLLLLLGLAAAVLVAYYSLVWAPQARARAQLPAEIDRTYAQIEQIAEDVDARDQAQAMQSEARRALQDDRHDTANSVHAEMLVLLTRLSLSYDLKIISRPNQLSGVWRVPSVNEAVRNYYLIVEAVNRAGKAITVPIENEEDGRIYSVAKWGVRVDEATFEAVAADKRDDGIIQGDVIGRKRVGTLEADYLVPTTGANITDW